MGSLTRSGAACGTPLVCSWLTHGAVFHGLSRSIGSTFGVAALLQLSLPRPVERGQAR